MNIRSLSNIPIPISTAKVSEAASMIKPQDTSERDADGRQPFGEKKRPVTKEELEKILESLKKHPGIVANQLQVLLVEEETYQIIYIKSADGQIVRRVPEQDFYTLLESLDQSNGRIFHKAA